MTKADLVAVLREVYELHGPCEVVGLKMCRVPPSKYADMTAEQIDEIWDFGERHMMHRVAKAIAACRT